jgi:hypothetical protein
VAAFDIDVNTLHSELRQRQWSIESRLTCHSSKSSTCVHRAIILLSQPDELSFCEPPTVASDIGLSLTTSASNTPGGENKHVPPRSIRSQLPLHLRFPMKSSCRQTFSPLTKHHQ